MTLESTEFALVLGGRISPASETFPVVNPATEESFANAPLATMSDIDRAVAASSKVSEDWRASLARRRHDLRQCANAVGEHAEEIAQLLALEHGKPMAKARLEVAGVREWFDDTSRLDVPDQRSFSGAHSHVNITRRPYGVVAAILPWNFPLMMMAWKVAPALLMGNSVITKPSPYTPLSSLLMGECLCRVLPEGALSVVTGDERTARGICAHLGVDKISLTGSVEAGKSLIASEPLKHATMELGGNDAAIVLPDMDVENHVEELFWSAFANSGQICTGIKRLYIHKNIFEEVLERMRLLAEGVVVGGQFDADVQMGPVNNVNQLRKMEYLVQDATASGGVCISGGRRLARKGYFFPPTLVKSMSDGCRLVTEEQFGPVLPLLVYDDIAMAVSRANATRYGLGGSVWSQDVEYAKVIASRLECGTVWINWHGPIWGNAPFCGWKESGLGAEHGEWGLREYSQAQVMHIRPEREQ